MSGLKRPADVALDDRLARGQARGGPAWHEGSRVGAAVEGRSVVPTPSPAFVLGAEKKQQRITIDSLDSPPGRGPTNVWGLGLLLLGICCQATFSIQSLPLRSR